MAILQGRMHSDAPDADATFPDPNEGQIVDWNARHFAARSLVMFAASFIMYSTFERPTFEGMSEGTDYIVRQIPPK